MQLATGASRTILVVDDDLDSAHILGEVLRSVGHEVTVATEPREGLELASLLHPEIALLDLGLPFMDGVELARKIHQACPETRFIALTGAGLERDVKRTRDAGFVQFLLKPVDFDALLRAVADVV